MQRDWFSPAQLADRIARDGVPNREVGYFMLANLLFGSIIYYGAFTWGNPSWTLLSLLEFAVIVIITLLGMTRCYEAAGGDNNSNFAMQFNCLSFGVWFWCTVYTWVIYWSVVWLSRLSIFAAYRYENMGLVRNLSAIGGSLDWLWTFLALTLWQVTYFWWMQKVLQRINRQA